jgi:hypothetical protein
MSESFFVWLGSRRSRKFPISAKGCLLDQAMSAGLPVPNGGLVLDDFYLLARQEEVAVVENGRIAIPDPIAFHTLLYAIVRYPQLLRPCTVRPLYPQPHPPLLHQTITEPANLAAAFTAVWNLLPLDDETTRRDLLIQEMVAGQTGGTAVYTPTELQITPHNATPYTLTPLRRWQPPSRELPPSKQRLQLLLRGVRRSFRQPIHQVDWLDDGHVCYIIQLHPPSAR